MKILKSGNNPFKRTCKRCGCVFLYTNDDVKTKEYEFGSGFDPECYVICPECGLQIYAKRIPDVLPDEEDHCDL